MLCSVSFLKGLSFNSVEKEITINKHQVVFGVKSRRESESFTFLASSYIRH